MAKKNLEQRAARNRGLLAALIPRSVANPIPDPSLPHSHRIAFFYRLRVYHNSPDSGERQYKRKDRKTAI